jgi:hypothetical protein
MMSLQQLEVRSGRVAQLAEQCPFKAWVDGSSPSALTKSFNDFGRAGNRRFPVLHKFPHKLDTVDFLPCGCDRRKDGVGVEQFYSLPRRAAGYVRVVTNHTSAHVADKRLDNAQRNP